MAKKNFKKGVKNVIEPFDKQKSTNNAADNKKSSQKKQTNTNIVKLSPSFLVQNVDEAKSKLSNLLQQDQPVTVTSEEVTEIDLSYIQLLIAFENAAYQKSIKVNWDLKISDEIIKLLRSIGMCHIMHRYEHSE